MSDRPWIGKLEKPKVNQTLSYLQRGPTANELPIQNDEMQTRDQNAKVEFNPFRTLQPLLDSHDLAIVRNREKLQGLSLERDNC